MTEPTADEVLDQLTWSEARILAAMLKVAPAPLDREQMVGLVSPDKVDRDAGQRNVKLVAAHIYGLRRKVGHHHIRTVEGIGYGWRP